MYSESAVSPFPVIRRNAPCTILYKMEQLKYETPNLSSTGRERPQQFENITLIPLHKNVRPITYEKYKDMMQLFVYHG